MTGLFLKVINMSISASWLVLAVLTCRLVLKKAPKWVNVLLWGIVAVRLLFPFSVESALSLIPSAETVSPEIMMDAAPTIHTGISAINSVVNPVISQSLAPAPGAGVNPLQIWIPVLAAVWLIGVVGLLAYTGATYWRLRRKVDTAVLFRDNIFQTENVSSPFVLGIIRPRIYLPFRMDEQDIQHVAAHELAHIRRRDHWWKPLGFLLLTVYWFNPLMWLAYVLMCRDIELACDEKVIKELDSEQRADYTQALLTCSVNRRMVAACPLAFGEVGVKARVKSVMNYKKPAFWIVAVAVIACVAVAVCFLTNPVVQHKSLTWAQTLSVDDVGQIELVVMPQDKDKAYKILSEDEVKTVVSLINHSKGRHERNYEVLGGRSIFFYLTMKDGSTHSVGNIGNVYLAIDGSYFEAPYKWLSTWDNAYGAGNSEIPKSFFDEQKSSVLKWFDYFETADEKVWYGSREINIPEFPGVTFRHITESMYAITENDTVPLYTGMPIWSAYFYDLTGDGLPEICSTISFGSGLTDNRIRVYDYANGVSYDLEDRGNFDYTLRLDDEDGFLYADKTVYRSGWPPGEGELVSSGRLVFVDNGIQVRQPS